MSKFNTTWNLAYAYIENGEVEQVFVYHHSESKRENNSTDSKFKNLWVNYGILCTCHRIFKIKNYNVTSNIIAANLPFILSQINDFELQILLNNIKLVSHKHKTNFMKFSEFI